MKKKEKTARVRKPIFFPLLTCVAQVQAPCEIITSEGLWLSIVSPGGENALQGCHTSWHCWALPLPGPEPVDLPPAAHQTQEHPGDWVVPGGAGWISLLKLEVRIIYSHFNRTTAALYLETSQEHWKNLDLNCRWMDFNLSQVAGLHDSVL